MNADEKSLLTGAGAARPHCRLEITDSYLEELEDGETLSFIVLRCKVHGATWREFVGGTTRLSCKTRESVYSQEGPSEGSQEEATCDDDLALDVGSEDVDGT